MVKEFEGLDIWISVGSDAGLSFATVGQVAKDSSMMQGILLSLQSLMTTEVQVGNSQFMTGENEYVKFGTFTITENNYNVVTQYIVRSSKPNSITDKIEKLVQEITLSFCKYLSMMPNFADYLESGRMIPKDLISKAFLNAVTIARQKIYVPASTQPLVNTVSEVLKLAEKEYNLFPTLTQMLKLDEWLGNDEKSWEQGTILPFKRNLIIQMLALDILNYIVDSNPICVLEYPTPRNIVEDIQKTISDYLHDKKLSPKELINEYLGASMDKILAEKLKSLNISQIHSADTFIASMLSKEIIIKIAKNNPLLALVDFRALRLYRTLREEIAPLVQISTPGDIICNSLIEDINPFILETARIFYHQLISPFKGRLLPKSIWNVIVDFTYALIDEEIIKKDATKKGKTKSLKATIKLRQEILFERLDELNITNKKLIEELKEIFQTQGMGKQLEISNIEESVIFANALESAIISAFRKVINQQLFNSSLGTTFQYIYELYKEIIPKKVFVNILSELFRALEGYGIPYEKQVAINTDDLLASSIEEGFVQAYIRSIPVKRKKKLFQKSKLVFDGRTILGATVLKQKNVSFQIEGKIFSLREMRSNSEFLLSALTNEKVLKRAYANAFLRKVTSTYVNKLEKFESEVLKIIDEMITAFTKEKSSSLRPIQRLPVVKKKFPTFPKIQNIPKELKGKNYHTRIKNIWKNYEAKIEKIINDLKVSFAKIKPTDLNYKNNALKTYDKAIKQLKSVRAKLLQSWEKVSSELSKNTEVWSKKAVERVSQNLSLAVRNMENWIGNEFKVRKLELGKLLPTQNECKENVTKAIKESLPKDIDELPDYFLEIALSILLYKRIPDYVINLSFEQLSLRNKKFASSIKTLWAKSVSRQEFEQNLYLNMRFLATTLTTIIRKLSININSSFVKNDMELLWDKKGFYIVLGAVPKELYMSSTEVEAVVPFEGIEIAPSGKDWIIKLYVTPEYKKEMEKYRDQLLVLSDAIRFAARLKFGENSRSIVQGIKSVIRYLIENGEQNVIDLTETINESIFKLSQYPTLPIKEE